MSQRNFAANNDGAANNTNEIGMNKLRQTFDNGAIFHAMSIIVLVFAVLYLAKPVVIPIALSILLTFVLTPAVLWLEKWKVPRMPAVLTVALATFGMMIGVIWTTASQIHSLAGELPNHRAEIQEKLDLLKSDSGSVFSRFGRMVDELSTGFSKSETDSGTQGQALSNETFVSPTGVPNTTAQAPTVVVTEARPPLEVLLNAVKPVLEPLATGCVVVVLVLFFLIKREDVRFRLFSLRGEGSLTGTTRLLTDASDRVSRYLLYLLMVNATFGIWFGLGLYFIGVPYAVLWGFLTLALRFIPYLGSPASVLFPLLISIATSNGWGEPVAVLVFFGVSELFVANVVEPILFGRSTGLSPIALLVAVLFWAWIWGPIGLLLSTPLTVCLVVLGQHIPALRWLKVLLAENPEMDDSLQYYQRLLAQDSAEARTLLARHVTSGGAIQAFDEVIVPALEKARLEREVGDINAKEASFIFETTWELVEEMVVKTNDDSAPDDGKKPLDDSDLGESSDLNTVESAPRRLFYGYPAHHQADELALNMLQQTLPASHKMSLASTRTLPSVVLKEIELQKPLAVVIAVIPPGGLPQVEYFCEECRRCSPTTLVIVAILGELEDYDRLLVELRRLGASYLTTSLEQTRNHLMAMDTKELDAPKSAVPPPKQRLVSASRISK